MSETTFQSVQHVKPEHPHDKLLREAREADAAAREASRLSPEEMELATVEFDQMSPEEKQEALRQERHPLTTNAGEKREGVNYDDLLATARTRTGRQIHDWADVSPDSVLTVGNVQASAAILLKSGLLSVNPVTGKFMPKADPTSAELEAKAAAEAAQDSGPVRDHLAKDFHAAVDELNVLTEGKATATIGAIIAQTVAADGDVTRAAEQLASRIGVEKDYSASVISNAIASGTKTAAEYISRNFPGVDGKAVIELASQTGSKSERASRINRIVLGDRSVFSELVADYRKQQRREEFSTKR